MEMMVTTGAIRRKKLQLKCRYQHLVFFTGRMHFLPPIQQCQSTKWKDGQLWLCLIHMWAFVCTQRLQDEVERLQRSRAGAVDTVQQQVDSALAQLQSQTRVDHHSVDCLVTVVALLCGAICPLYVRASELAEQRNLLTAQLQRFDAFKQQVVYYAAAAFCQLILTSLSVLTPFFQVNLG